MGSWSAPTGGGLLHTGATSDPDVYVLEAEMTGQGALVVQILDPSKPVGIRIYASPLADTAWEIIPDGGTGGDYVLNKWLLGTEDGGNPIASAAHGLADGDTYTIEVRWVNGTISAYLNGSSTALWSYDTAGEFNQFARIALSCSVDGGRVGTIKLYTLTRTFAALADVFWMVCNGTLYASDSGRNGLRAIGTFFDPQARVQGAEGQQHAYIIDGSRIIDFDAALMTAAPHTLTAGLMPGQTALNTPPGATTAKVVAWYNGRLLLSQDQYAIASAINDPADFDLTVTTLGKAFVWPSEVGEPLIGIFVHDKNRLILCSRRATWELTGDPSLGAEVTNLSSTLGCTGPFSAVMVSKGLLLTHSQEGLLLTAPGAAPGYLSRDILTEILQDENAADNTLVTIVQDTKRHGTWVFLTPSDGTSNGRHIFYEERSGAFNPSLGGYWPIDFGDPDAQPTCACRYLDEVLWGTRDGRILYFTAAATDDAGTDFDTKLMLQMVKPEDVESGILIRDFVLVMGLGGGTVDLTLLGGESPERAFDDTAWELWSDSMKYTRNTFSPSRSAPAVVLQLSATGVLWSLERCQVNYNNIPSFPMRKLPKLAPAAPCTPPTPPTPPEEGNTGGGPGPGGNPPPGGGETEDPPEEPACTECADWMALNTTGEIGGQDAYRMAGPNTLIAAQAEAAAAAEIIKGQNICLLGSNFNVWVANITDPDDDWTDIAMPINDFLAMTDDPDVPPSLRAGTNNGKGWSIYFRCADQP